MVIVLGVLTVGQLRRLQFLAFPPLQDTNIENNIIRAILPYLG